MKLILYCGLHKTGTTSLQGLLFDEFRKLEKDRPYYPRPEFLGPGHTYAIDIFNKTGNLDLINSWIKDVNLFNSSHLIIASEEIYSLPPKKIETLITHLKFNFSKISIVLTNSPYVKKTRSAYIELIKNGWQGQLEYSLNKILMQPTLNNITIEKFLSIAKDFNPIVIFNKNFNKNLVDIFLQATGLPSRSFSSDIAANKSYDEFDAEFWRLVNRYRRDIDGPTYHAAQREIESVLRSNEWQKLRHHIPTHQYRLPKSWEDIINDRAIEQKEIFSAFEDKIISHGEKESICLKYPDLYKEGS